jgi:hypothetical protein
VASTMLSNAVCAFSISGFSIRSQRRAALALAAIPAEAG